MGIFDLPRTWMRNRKESKRALVSNATSYKVVRRWLFLGRGSYMYARSPLCSLLLPPPRALPHHAHAQMPCSITAIGTRMLSQPKINRTQRARRKGQHKLRLRYNQRTRKSKHEDIQQTPNTAYHLSACVSPPSCGRPSAIFVFASQPGIMERCQGVLPMEGRTAA